MSSFVGDSLPVAHWRAAPLRVLVVSRYFVHCVLEKHVVFLGTLFGRVLELAVVNVLHIVLIELTVLWKLVPEWNEEVFDL